MIEYRPQILPQPDRSHVREVSSCSHENDENIFVGALRFPGENLVLDSKVASFVENVRTADPGEGIPKVTVTFGDLRVNGTPVEKPSATAVYPKGIPDSPRPSSRTASWSSKSASRCRNGKNGGWSCCQRSGCETTMQHAADLVFACYNSRLNRPPQSWNLRNDPLHPFRRRRGIGGSPNPGPRRQPLRV